MQETTYSRALKGYMSRAGIADYDELGDRLGDPYDREFIEKTTTDPWHETNAGFWIGLREALELTQGEHEELFFAWTKVYEEKQRTNTPQ